jgi:hypothetical protein
VVLNNGGKNKKRKEKKPKIVATFVYASSQGQRTHSARTKISGKQAVGQMYQTIGNLPD